ncbi:MAG: response regulator [Candidatus Jettenia sp. CY-1]|nr:response regulator [Candidatus Jettenia sp.]WKZ18079.1 MAG: response regulator [Candidatus Jettenia sp. CY-1]
MPSARILIVEDERQTVDTLRDLFEQHGYEAEVALNKQVALAILQERKMDLLILSTTVQENLGIEILREIRKMSPSLPAIMISDQKSKRVESSSTKAGANIFIVKPFDDEFILHTVENLLESRFDIPVSKKTKTYPKGKK